MPPSERTRSRGLEVNLRTRLPARCSDGIALVRGRLTSEHGCPQQRCWGTVDFMSSVPAGRQRLSTARYGATIRGESFDLADLSVVALDQEWFDRCSFVDVDFRHATLVGCHFKLCDFRRAVLRGGSLRNARFAGCDFRAADLRDCDFRGATFGYVNTGDVNGLTNMTDVIWSAGVPSEASFDRVVGLLQSFAPPLQRLKPRDQVRRTIFVHTSSLVTNRRQATRLPAHHRNRRRRVATR